MFLIILGLLAAMLLSVTSCSSNPTVKYFDPTDIAVKRIENYSNQECELLSKAFKNNKPADNVSSSGLPFAVYQDYWECIVGVKGDPKLQYTVYVKSPSSVSDNYDFVNRRYSEYKWRSHLEKGIEAKLLEKGIKAKCHFLLGSEAMSCYMFTDYSEGDTLLEYMRKSEATIATAGNKWVIIPEDKFKCIEDTTRATAHNGWNFDSFTMATYTTDEVFASKFIALQLLVDDSCANASLTENNLRSFLQEFKVEELNNEFYPYFSCIHLSDSATVEKELSYTCTNIQDLREKTMCFESISDVDLYRGYTSKPSPNCVYTTLSTKYDLGADTNDYTVYFTNYTADSKIRTNNSSLENMVFMLQGEMTKAWISEHTTETAEYLKKAESYNEKFPYYK